MPTQKFLSKLPLVLKVLGVMGIFLAYPYLPKTLGFSFLSIGVFFYFAGRSLDFYLRFRKAHDSSKERF